MPCGGREPGGGIGDERIALPVARGPLRKLAERAEDPEIRRACRALADIWREIEPLAANFDRVPDPLSKQRIYELIDAIAVEQRKVA